FLGILVEFQKTSLCLQKYCPALLSKFPDIAFSENPVSLIIDHTDGEQPNDSVFLCRFISKKFSKLNGLVAGQRSKSNGPAPLRYIHLNERHVILGKYFRCGEIFLCFSLFSHFCLLLSIIHHCLELSALT